MKKDQIGRLLRQLRKERGLTQGALAQALHVSDKAISKWERGAGLPDISMLADLSAHFGVNVAALLAGDLQEKEQDGGNMKRIRFFVCPNCGNISTASGSGELSCCGRALHPLVAQEADGDHQFRIQTMEEDYYVEFDHPMTKSHHLSFVAWVDDHRLLLIRLYPEQGGYLRFPKINGGNLYSYCVKDGLWQHTLP